MKPKKTKKVLLLGGSGVIGQILQEYLATEYSFVSFDIVKPSLKYCQNFIKQDIKLTNSFLRKIPNETDSVINLIGIPEQSPVVNPMKFNLMLNIYIKCTYNALLAAVLNGVPQVILASSNHVTDAYELNGKSLINRKIKVSDYPYSNGIYGALKLCAENLGFVFTQNYGLNVINLRIGTVRLNEDQYLKTNKRSRNTILRKSDVAKVFTSAIESNIQYGTYYAASVASKAPWDMKNLTQDFNL